MNWLHRQWADIQGEAGQNAYHYWFRHDPPYDEGRGNLGAAHTGEIPYVFGNLCAPRTFPGGSSVDQMCGNAEEEAFADQVSQYWVNFAATGNPNGTDDSGDLPYWPSVTELGENETMILDAGNSGKGQFLTPEKIELYDAMFQARVAGPLGIGE